MDNKENMDNKDNMENKDYKENKEYSDTQRHILQAAETEFFQKGFKGARTTAIAEAAGVTHAMLHYYYSTKEKLFEKVIDEKLTALARTFVIGIEADSSLRDCVRMAVERHFDFVLANPLLPRFMVSDVFRDEKLMESLAEKLGVFASNTVNTLQDKINVEVSFRECGYIDATTLILDIVSLNVFPILAAPMVGKVMGFQGPEDYEDFFEERKNENVEIILSRLRL